MKIKMPVLMEISRKLTALALAIVMLFDLSAEAAAQVRSLPNTQRVVRSNYINKTKQAQRPAVLFSFPQKFKTRGDVLFENRHYTAPADNTRVATRVYSVLQSKAGIQSTQYDQFKSIIRSNFKNVNLTEAQYGSLYAKYVDSINAQNREVSEIYSMYRNADTQKLSDLAFKQAFNSNGHPRKILIGKRSFSYVSVAQALVRIYLNKAYGPTKAAGRTPTPRYPGETFFTQGKVTREDLMNLYFDDLYKAVSIAGVNAADRKAAQKYFRSFIGNGKCDNDTYITDIMPGLGTTIRGTVSLRKIKADEGKEQRLNECQKMGYAMTALTMVDESVQDRGADARTVYEVLLKGYKGSYGAMLAMSSISALIGFDTKSSYAYIDRFLTYDSLKRATDFGTVWNGCKWVLGLLSVQQWVEMTTNANNTARGRGGRYLNQLGSIYQYIDDDAARGMGMSDFQVSSMKTNPSLGYNIPYGNVLEDIGVMISNTGTVQGNAIANKIVNTYAQALSTNKAAINRVHIPLVIGVLKSGRVRSSAAAYAARRVNALDWWDLNEATQRRINNAVTAYAGTVQRNANQAKVKRNERNQKIINASVWADMALTAVCVFSLVASLPSIVRSIGSLARNISRIRAINAAGKGNLLRIVRANIKTLPVKPAEIKASIAARQIQAAREARAEALLARRGVKSNFKSSFTAKVNQAKGLKPVVKTVKKPGTQQIQYKLVDKQGNVFANQNGTLTAVIGEGSGGSAAGKMTAAEKAVAAKRMAADQAIADAKAQAAAEEMTRENAYALAHQTPFKGNILFNKPYNQLAPWRKKVFDLYYWHINPAFTLSGDLSKFAVKNPMKATMMGSVPFGTTAEALLVNPVGIYSSIGARTETGFRVLQQANEASALARGGEAAGTIAKTGATLKAPAALTPMQKLMLSAGIFSMPKIVALEGGVFGGGAVTGDKRFANLLGSSFTSAAKVSTAKGSASKETKTPAKVAAASSDIVPAVPVVPAAVKADLISNNLKTVQLAANQSYVAAAPKTQAKIVTLESVISSDKKYGTYYQETGLLASAWNRLVKDPTKGRMDEVVLTVNVGGKTFVINRGAALRNPKTHKIEVQGMKLKTAFGTFDNFGLAKIIYKHGPYAVTDKAPVTKDDVLKIPYILRNYSPISESDANHVIYRIFTEKGPLFLVFNKIENGSYMLVTMYHQLLIPGKTLEFSGKNVAATQVASSNIIFKGDNSVAAKPANVPLVADNILPPGWSLFPKNEAAKKTLFAETQVRGNLNGVAPNAAVSTFSDPLVLASFFMIPFIFKMKSIGKKDKVAEDQAYGLSKQAPASADELIGAENDEDFDSQIFSGDKLLLSYENKDSGKETILPVDLDIDKSFKTKGYNRVYFNKEGIAELRNGHKSPKTMSRFFMKLDGFTEDFRDFAGLAAKAKLDGDLKVKLVQTSKRRSVKTSLVRLYTEDLKSLPVEVELPASLMGPEDALVMKASTGELAIIRKGQKTPEAIEDYYIRLPKNQINNIVSILQISPRRFSIGIGSTKDKAGVVIRDVSMTNVSLGKTFAPVVKGSLGMSEANANSLMFCINYLLPGLSSLLNPVLKRFGERKLLLLSLCMSALAGVVATSAGFYGFVDSMPHNDLRTYAFVASISLMAVAGILKQLVSNMLIKANRGDVAATKTNPADKKAAASAKDAAKPEVSQKVTFSDVTRRFKEVFTKKSDMSLQDAFFYNLSFMFKNFGTLLFLALPYMVDLAVKLVTGVDLHLDFSLSFPIYAAFSTMALLKVYRAHLRDAYDSKPGLKESPMAIAKEAERNAGKASDQALNTKKPAAAAVAAKPEVKHNVVDVFLKHKSVRIIAYAMSLATIHEFVLSSSFASILSSSFNSGSTANFWVALCLYVPLVAGRLLGNVASQRMTPSSLYISFSALSAIGTAIVAAFINSPVAVMVGASIASIGIGNFFTQMYNYITDKHPDYNREVSVILSLTLAVGALGAIPPQYMIQLTHIKNLGIIYAMACLVGSLLLTGNMMSGSTLYKYLTQTFLGGKNGGKNNNPGSEQKNSGKQNKREQRPHPTPVDMGSPLTE